MAVVYDFPGKSLRFDSLLFTVSIMTPGRGNYRAYAGSLLFTML